VVGYLYVIETETMRSVKELRSRQPLELQTSNGSGLGTLRGGLRAAGAEKSSNCDRVPGDVAFIGPPQVGPRRSGEGRGKPLEEGSARPNRVENFRERPMSSCGLLSVEVMMILL
jgi:hypothetical protein